jgi:hypothetical protein
MTLKYSRRRAILKKAQNPLVALARKWKKASPLMKGAIVGGAILPKALLLGAGYYGAKSVAKKNKKQQPKKYMVG